MEIESDDKENPAVAHCIALHCIALHCIALPNIKCAVVLGNCVHRIAMYIPYYSIPRYTSFLRKSHENCHLDWIQIIKKLPIFIKKIWCLIFKIKSKPDLPVNAVKSFPRPSVCTSQLIYITEIFDKTGNIVHQV